jgi:hypothetical protein
MLFALFTAAGTAFLMKGGFARRDAGTVQPPVRHSTPATATVRQVLEPAIDDVEAASVGPTASGPLGVKPTAKVGDLFVEITNRPAANEVTSSMTTPPAEAVGQSLPRVQTTDPQTAEAVAEVAQTAAPGPPPAIARLPGIIHEAPPRQAQHDENQSGLH